MNLPEKIQKIQSELKCPKSQYNSFGKYKYRNCEDIMEALKPLLNKHNVALIMSDRIDQVGDRIYVRAMATAKDIEGMEEITVSAYAREEETKKGMDASQITGAASSYARKYALDGMFLIDDTKDSDSTNDHGKDKNPAPKQSEKKDPAKSVEVLNECTGYGELKELFSKMQKYPELKESKEVQEAFKRRTQELTATTNHKDFELK